MKSLLASHFTCRVMPLLVRIWLGLWLVGLIASLAWLEIDRSGTEGARALNTERLLPFMIASIGLWLGLSGLWLELRRYPADGGRPRRFRRDACWVLGVAVASRIAVLATSDAALSDDIYRYVFDGRNVADGLNPYLNKPADRLSATDERWPGEAQLVPLLAYGEMATPYMPLSQFVLGAFGFAVNDHWSDPISSARVFRAGFVLVELGMILMLLVAVQRCGKSAWWVALYAWHPLPIAEIAHAGHQDIIGVALLVAALTAFSDSRGRTWLWSLLLATAAMVKPVAAPAALFMLRGRRWTAWLQSLVLGLVVAATLSIPFHWIPGSSAFDNWYSTAKEMSDKWAHFAAVYESSEYAVRKIFPETPESSPGWNLVQERRARMLCMAILAVVFVLIWRARLDVWRSTAALMLAIVLLSTTAHPWYLLWAFALAPLAMSWTLWVYSLTISLGYVVFISGKSSFAGEEWTAPIWAELAGYLPVAGAIIYDLLQFRRQNPPGSAHPQDEPA